MTTRTLDIVHALEADLAASYTEIGRKFGISRERIRQIAKRELGETGHSRQRIRALVAREKAQIERAGKPIPKWFFIGMVRYWLAAEGYGYCCECHSVNELGDMTPSNRGTYPKRCLACGAARSRKFYATPEGRAYSRRYAKAHPEICAAASRRWYLRLKAEGRCKCGAPTTDGHLQCPGCAARSRESQKRQYWKKKAERGQVTRELRAN